MSNAPERCPECGSRDITSPDEDGWQFCNFCGEDFERMNGEVGNSGT
jgi:DNA-directed RNA polymerase subunit RPC12/RpoP